MVFYQDADKDTAPLCAAGYQHVTSLWQPKIRVLEVVITTWQYVFWHVKYWNWGLLICYACRQIVPDAKDRGVFIFVMSSSLVSESLDTCPRTSNLAVLFVFLHTLLSPPSEEESSIKLDDARKGDEGLNEGLCEGILSLQQDESAFSLSVLIFRYSF